jgi:PAS domain S-box-containing protein
VTPFSVSPSVLALYIAGATALVLAVGFAGSIIDRRISEKTELLEAALQNMFQGLCMLNGKREVMVVNERFLEMFGIAQHQIRPLMPARELMELAERSVPFGAETLLNMQRWWLRLMREKKSGKAIFQRGDGRVYSVSHRHMPAMDGWVDTFEDITERRNAEQKIAHMARHDTLTGLPNRMHFRERFETAVAAVDRTAGSRCYASISTTSRSSTTRLVIKPATRFCKLRRSASRPRCARMISQPGSAAMNLRSCN